MNLEAFKECKTSSFLAHPQLFGNNSLQTKVFKESTSQTAPQAIAAEAMAEAAAINDTVI